MGGRTRGSDGGKGSNEGADGGMGLDGGKRLDGGVILFCLILSFFNDMFVYVACVCESISDVSISR